MPFPEKLHHIIEKAVSEEYDHIISWQKHGRAFKIHNEELFLSKIIFKYFFMRNIAIFTRQMEVYGFQRIMNGDSEDFGAYFHELFLRQRPDLCFTIGRVENYNLVSQTNEPKLSDYAPMPFPKSNNVQVNNKVRSVNQNIISQKY